MLKCEMLKAKINDVWRLFRLFQHRTNLHDGRRIELILQPDVHMRLFDKCWTKCLKKTFSSPEAAILLVSTKDRDLWQSDWVKMQNDALRVLKNSAPARGLDPWY